MTIAVTGASGQLGRLTIEALKERAGANAVVALARAPEKIADAGVAARAFDYDSVETLARAPAGVDTLVFISSSEIGKRVAQHHAVIAAANAAGVGRIVYTSVLRADTSPLSVADEHRPTEAELKASGVSFTTLRNGWYTENYAGSIAGALRNGALIGSAGEGRISSAARVDYAQALAVDIGVRGARLDQPLERPVVDFLGPRTRRVHRDKHVSIRIGPLPNSELIARKLGTIELWPCASPACPAARGTPETVEALLKHRLIVHTDRAFRGASGHRQARSASSRPSREPSSRNPPS